MPKLGLISAAFGAARAVAGAVQANQDYQKRKGILARAYRLGQERQGLQQGDARETQGESLIARGLAGGGSVNTAVQSGLVGGAHDLGGQAVADLGHEQGLERDALAADYDAQRSDNKAQRTQGMIGALMGGAQTAVSAYSAGKDLQAMKSMPDQGLHPAAQPWGGIHVTDPLGQGAWAQPTNGAPSSGAFNVYSPQRGMGSF